MPDELQILELKYLEWTLAQEELVPPSSPSSDASELREHVFARAANLRSLSEARNQLGFSSLPLPEFLMKLARHARVSLDTLLLKPTGGDSILVPWIRLAKAAELPNREVSVLTRLFVARHFNTTGAVHARGIGALNEPVLSENSSIEELESRLEQIEQSYGPQSRQVLDQLLGEI